MQNSRFSVFAALIPSRTVLACAGALLLVACYEQPPAPEVDRESAAPPARASEASTGRPAPDEARPLPAPSAVAPLAQKVKDALVADPQVNALEIDVVASQGAVTLYGTAATAASRERAARVAAGVEGVKSVRNQLAVVAGS